MNDPVPADDAAAELAVVRPHLPALNDLLDGTVAPLSVVFGLDDQRLDAFAAEIVRLGRVTEAGRLIIGAALHNRRPDYDHGSWTPFVRAFAERHGVATRTLGDWMTAAEKHYGLELPKAAKPTRRKDAIGGNRQRPPVSPPDAEVLDRERRGLPPREKPPLGPPLSTPGGGGTPGVDRPPVPASGSSTRDEEPREDPPPPALIRPLCPECDSPVAWDGSGWQHADGRRYRHKIVLLHPQVEVPARRFEGSSGETATKAHTPDLGGAVATALDAILDAQPTELAKLAEAERTKVAAAHRALGRALRDTEHRVGAAAPVLPGQVPARESAGEAPDAPAQAGCLHPKGKRQVKSWGTVCGDCGARVS